MTWEERDSRADARRHGTTAARYISHACEHQAEAEQWRGYSDQGDDRVAFWEARAAVAESAAASYARSAFSAAGRALAAAFQAHQAADPHCTCNDCIEDFAAKSDAAIAASTEPEPEPVRFQCACGWRGQLSRSSINCPICFRKLRERQPR
jgi:hypothetical protein